MRRNTRVMTTAPLSATGITVRYAGVPVLRDVAIELQPGAIHALVGENGAGKSTLMKVLAGARPPDTGTIAMHGEVVQFRSPRDAHRAGIRMIQQELSLVPGLTVAENIVLGAEPSRWGMIDRRALRARAARAIDGLGASIDSDRPVERLALAQRQMVEIAKALAADAPGGLRVLILDEPTAILSAHETDALHTRLIALRSRGLAILYCTHRLDEIDRLADHVTVLRDGVRVGGGPIRALPPAALIPLMVGRAIERRRWRAPAGMAAGPVVLAVEHLTTVPGTTSRAASRASRTRSGSRSGDPPVIASTDVRDATFDLRAGEIVGLVGLVGAGRSEVALALIGALPRTAGTVRLRGSPIQPRWPRDAVRAGIGFVPEDRAASALISHDSVRVNTTLVALRGLARWGVVDRARERSTTRHWVESLRIKTPSIETPVRRLSGGNQQKVVLARWLAAGESRLSVLIVDEPTRGVDVGARAEIYDALRALATNHTAVLVITSDLVEAIALCDRLLVMRDGRIVGELTGADQTAEDVASLMVPS
jgi:L-arabinose transport system ATP-binding protein